MDKYVKGYEGIYRITVDGVVYTDQKIGYRGKLIPKRVKNQRLVGGYYGVTLVKDKKPLTKKIHRLLAETYIPNTHNKPVVNHKDGNKLNNNLDNLEWCTILENVTHAWKNKLVDYKERKLIQLSLLLKMF